VSPCLACLTNRAQIAPLPALCLCVQIPFLMHQVDFYGTLQGTGRCE
jgi:hypothetical protein